MNNDILELLRKRQKDAEDEGMVAAVASGLGSVLMGDTGGEVAGYGADLVGGRIKRRESLQDQEHKSLLAELKAKSGGSKAKPVVKNVYDPQTGKTVYKWFTAPGEAPIETGATVGFAPKIFEDEEKRTTVASTGAGLKGFRTYTPDKPGKEQGISPYFKKRSDKVSDDFFASTKKDREAVKEAVQGLQMITMKGIMPKKSALNNVVKMTEGGRMTDEDRTFILGAVGKIAQLSEDVAETTDKTIVQRKLTEAADLYKKIIEINASYLQDLADKSARSTARSDKEYKYMMDKLKKSLIGE